MGVPRSQIRLNSCVNRPRIVKRKLIDINASLDNENATEVKLKAFSSKGENWVEFAVSLFTASEANGGVKHSVKRSGRTIYKSEHWTDKSKRHRQQKIVVAIAMRPLKVREFIKMPCNITITRYAPRKLDRFDNLPMSVKYILDSICEQITGDYVAGRADSHEQLSVTYDQVVSKQYFIKVKIENKSI